MNMKNILFRITHWETWPWWTKYILILPVWIWNCIRSGSLWFFTASNPTLTFGGFDGESKREMYAQLPPGSYPKTIYIDKDAPFETAKTFFAEENFQFPFAVKPDVGKMGYMFRRIYSIDEFKLYHETI